MGELLEKPDNLSDCEPETRTDVSVVPVVTERLGCVGGNSRRDE